MERAFAYALVSASLQRSGEDLRCCEPVIERRMTTEARRAALRAGRHLANSQGGGGGGGDGGGGIGLDASGYGGGSSTTLSSPHGAGGAGGLFGGGARVAVTVGGAGWLNISRIVAVGVPHGVQYTRDNSGTNGGNSRGRRRHNDDDSEDSNDEERSIGGSGDDEDRHADDDDDDDGDDDADGFGSMGGGNGGTAGGGAPFGFLYVFKEDRSGKRLAEKHRLELRRLEAMLVLAADGTIITGAADPRQEEVPEGNNGGDADTADGFMLQLHFRAVPPLLLSFESAAQREAVVAVVRRLVRSFGSTAQRRALLPRSPHASLGGTLRQRGDTTTSGDAATTGGLKDKALAAMGLQLRRLQQSGGRAGTAAAAGGGAKGGGSRSNSKNIRSRAAAASAAAAAADQSKQRAAQLRAAKRQALTASDQRRLTAVMASVATTLIRQRTKQHGGGGGGVETGNDKAGPSNLRRGSVTPPYLSSNADGVPAGSSSAGGGDGDEAASAAVGGRQADLGALLGGSTGPAAAAVRLFDQISVVQHHIDTRVQRLELDAAAAVVAVHRSLRELEGRAEGLADVVADIDDRIATYADHVLQRKATIDDMERTIITLQRQERNFRHLHARMSTLHDALSLPPGADAAVEKLLRLGDAAEDLVAFFCGAPHQSEAIGAAMRHTEAVLHYGRIVSGGGSGGGSGALYSKDKLPSFSSGLLQRDYERRLAGRVVPQSSSVSQPPRQLEEEFPVLAVMERKRYFVALRRLIGLKAKTFAAAVIEAHGQQWQAGLYPKEAAAKQQQQQQQKKKRRGSDDDDDGDGALPPAGPLAAITNDRIFTGSSTTTRVATGIVRARSLSIGSGAAGGGDRSSLRPLASGGGIIIGGGGTLFASGSGAFAPARLSKRFRVVWRTHDAMAEQLAAARHATVAMARTDPEGYVFLLRRYASTGQAAYGPEIRAFFAALRLSLRKVGWRKAALDAKKPSTKDNKGTTQASSGGGGGKSYVDEANLRGPSLLGLSYEDYTRAEVLEHWIETNETGGEALTGAGTGGGGVLIGRRDGPAMSPFVNRSGFGGGASSPSPVAPPAASRLSGLAALAGLANNNSSGGTVYSTPGLGAGGGGGLDGTMTPRRMGGSVASSDGGGGPGGGCNSRHLSIELSEDNNRAGVRLHRPEAAQEAIRAAQRRQAQQGAVSGVLAKLTGASGGGFLRPDIVFGIAIAAAVDAVLSEEANLARCFGLSAPFVNAAGPAAARADQQRRQQLLAEGLSPAAVAEALGSSSAALDGGDMALVAAIPPPDAAAAQLMTIAELFSGSYAGVGPSAALRTRQRLAGPSDGHGGGGEASDEDHNSDDGDGDRDPSNEQSLRARGAVLRTNHGVPLSADEYRISKMIDAAAAEDRDGDRDDPSPPLLPVVQRRLRAVDWRYLRRQQRRQRSRADVAADDIAGLVRDVGDESDEDDERGGGNSAPTPAVFDVDSDAVSSEDGGADDDDDGDGGSDDDGAGTSVSFTSRRAGGNNNASTYRSTKPLLLQRNLLKEELYRLTRKLVRRCDRSYVPAMLAMVEGLLGLHRPGGANGLQLPNHNSGGGSAGGMAAAAAASGTDPMGVFAPPPPCAVSYTCLRMLIKVHRKLMSALRRYHREQRQSIVACAQRFLDRPEALLPALARLPLLIGRLEASFGALDPAVRGSYAHFDDLILTSVEAIFDMVDQISRAKLSGTGASGILLEARPPGLLKRLFFSSSSSNAAAEAGHALLAAATGGGGGGGGGGGLDDDGKSFKRGFLVQLRHNAFFCYLYATLHPHSHAAHLLQARNDRCLSLRDRYEEQYLSRVIFAEEMPNFARFIATCADLMAAYTTEELKHNRALSREAVSAAATALGKELPAGLKSSAARIKKHLTRDVRADSAEEAFHRELLKSVWGHYVTLVKGRVELFEELLSWSTFRGAVECPVSSAQVALLASQRGQKENLN